MTTLDKIFGLSRRSVIHIAAWIISEVTYTDVTSDFDIIRKISEKYTGAEEKYALFIFARLSEAHHLTTRSLMEIVKGDAIQSGFDLKDRDGLSKEEVYELLVEKFSEENTTKWN